MQDIDIARNAKLKPIVQIAKKLGIEESDIEQYGKYKAKIPTKLYDNLKENKNGKLILVTAINPTPLGEGKTTMAIRISRWITKYRKKSNISIITYGKCAGWRNWNDDHFGGKWKGYAAGYGRVSSPSKFGY